LVKGMVSVAAVITTHNRADVLSAAIESVLSQTRPADEVIVVDDGSTDDTGEVVRRFERHVRYVKLAESRGAGKARNSGVAAAASDLVAFLDDDDV
jgi:glycosyltransferase involved in cell wall biosynthesis